MWTADKIIYNGIDTYIKAYQGSSLIWEKTIVVDPSDDITLPYVTFRSEEAGSTLGLKNLCVSHDLKYSLDKSNWNTLDTNSTVTLSNIGDEVYVRGKLTAEPSSINDYTKFKMTGKIAAYGNCNAIWDYEDLEAPLKEYCGFAMFRGCTSLTKAPKLPATTLAYSCYGDMFVNCTSLTKAPELPATMMTIGCYGYMFEGCTSLVEAPKLPATTLDNGCYQYMFKGCTSLVNAPELPATELDLDCYTNMFEDCTSLTKAPLLPATTIYVRCYYQMFAGCTSLQEITCLATNISAKDCIYYWVNAVPSGGTFYKDPSMTSWPNGTSGIPSGWTVLDYTA